MSMLLENNILTRFMQVNVITGIILLVIGILLAFLASKITKMIKKTDKIEPSDKVFLTIKAVALVLVLISLIVMIIE